jgi:hypothetical protein
MRRTKLKLAETSSYYTYIDVILYLFMCVCQYKKVVQTIQYGRDGAFERGNKHPNKAHCTALTGRKGKTEDFPNGFIVQGWVIPKSGQLHRNRKKNPQFIHAFKHLQGITDQSGSAL